jgi:hypothetical protein
MPLTPTAMDATQISTPVNIRHTSHTSHTSRVGEGNTRRACGECKRKKARCGKEHPECALCVRVGSTCKYPSRRLISRKKSSSSAPKAVAAYDSLSEPSAAHVLMTPKAAEGESLQNEMANISSEMDMAEFDLTLGSYDMLGVPGSHLAHANTQPSPPYNLGGEWAYFDDQPISSPSIQYSSQLLWSLNDPLGTPDSFFPGNLDSIVTRGKADAGGILRESAASDHLMDSLISEAMNPTTPGIRVDIALVANELIPLFFSSIQPFLPLFQQPRFYEEFLNTPELPEQRYHDLPLVSEFLLNAMFGLSARFSTLPCLSTAKPQHRGVPFTDRAKFLWGEICKSRGSTNPPLACLQGLILLTFDALQSGPSHQAWTLCGACCNLAYDLDLQDTDRDIISGAIEQSSLSVGEWSLREEKRRSWWMVWEMDTFASALSRRPFGIDSRCMHILLPVSDQAWSSQEIVFSVPLNTTSNMVWKGLCDTPNQHRRLWFLACMSIHRQVFEAALVISDRENALKNVEEVVGAFVFALPEEFQQRSSILFDKNHFAESNWIVCTLVLLQR